MKITWEYDFRHMAICRSLIKFFEQRCHSALDNLLHNYQMLLHNSYIRRRCIQMHFRCRVAGNQFHPRGKWGRIRLRKPVTYRSLNPFNSAEIGAPTFCTSSAQNATICAVADPSPIPLKPARISTPHFLYREVTYHYDCAFPAGSIDSHSISFALPDEALAQAGLLLLFFAFNRQQSVPNLLRIPISTIGFVCSDQIMGHNDTV
jgi:hypothetical protein